MGLAVSLAAALVEHAVKPGGRVVPGGVAVGSRPLVGVGCVAAGCVQAVAAAGGTGHALAVDLPRAAMGIKQAAECRHAGREDAGAKGLAQAVAFALGGRLNRSERRLVVVETGV